MPFFRILLVAFPLFLLAACTSEPEENGGPVEPKALTEILPGIYETTDSLKGLYQYYYDPSSYLEYSTNISGRGLRRTRLQIRADGSYLEHEFFTSEDSTIVDFRFREERGSMEHKKSYLYRSQTSRFKLEPLIRSIGNWMSAYDERLDLRALDSASFETREYVGLPWREWRRISVPDLQSDFNAANVFTDPQAGYFLRLRPGWYSRVDEEINHRLYDFSSSRGHPGGASESGSLNALTSPKATHGQTVEQGMDSAIKAEGDWYGKPAVVLSRKTSVRGGRNVAEAVIRVTSVYSVYPYVYREKLVLFEGAHGDFVLIRYGDDDDKYDANTDFPAIDSSLTFF